MVLNWYVAENISVILKGFNRRAGGFNHREKASLNYES